MNKITGIAKGVYAFIDKMEENEQVTKAAMIGFMTCMVMMNIGYMIGYFMD